MENSRSTKVLISLKNTHFIKQIYSNSHANLGLKEVTKTCNIVEIYLSYLF